MADDHIIKNFTAADIEKYHKGLLSSKERHDLEKAALDDPFLADALEGYAVAGVNADADIADLNRRLTERTEQTKVIPIQRAGKPFPWLRIAVIAILIAGTGILSYQVLFKNSSGENSIAESQSPAKQKANFGDTVSKDLVTRSNNNSVTVSTEDPKDSVPYYKSDAAKSFNGLKTTEANKDGLAEKEVTSPGLNITPDTSTSRSFRNDNAAPPIANAVKPEAERLNGNAGIQNNNNAVALERKNNVKGFMGLSDDMSKAKKAPAQLNKPSTQQDFDYLDRKRDTVTFSDTYSNYNIGNKRAERDSTAGLNNVYNFGFKRTEGPYRPNVFRGQVTDNNNNALPFANITNTRDNVGTYSDAQGNFTLISSDTVLNVQVKSLGFENNNTQLRNSLAYNKVQMQEDKSLNAYVLDTVKRNLSMLRKNSLTAVEDTEPEDGWDSWDTYVVNNTIIPQSFHKKSDELTKNTVEVSFEVNKYGEPINLKVEKSLCEKCDQEALRIVKEGPKWKRKAKKSKRTTVTVPFVKPE